MSNPLEQLGGFINTILITLFDLLPDSPFREICNFVDEYEILGILNWIIPFDRFSLILDTWLLCVSAYYIFLYSKGLLSGKNAIIFRLLETFLG